MPNTAEARAVVLRAFDERLDVPEIAPVLADLWHPYAPTEAYRSAAGVYDFSQFAQEATFVLTAVVDGRFAGMVLARAGSPDPAWADRWKQVGDEALERLRALDERTARETVEFLEEEGRIDRELLAQAGCPDAYEVVLLALHERARGRGAGGMLFDAALDYLKGSGARQAFLYTDSSCSWQFYEHRGLVRLSEVRTGAAPADKLQSEYYLYSKSFD